MSLPTCRHDLLHATSTASLNPLPAALGKPRRNPAPQAGSNSARHDSRRPEQDLLNYESAIILALSHESIVRHRDCLRTPRVLLQATVTQSTARTVPPRGGSNRVLAFDVDFDPNLDRRPSTTTTKRSSSSSQEIAVRTPLNHRVKAGVTAQRSRPRSRGCRPIIVLLNHPRVWHIDVADWHRQFRW